MPVTRHRLLGRRVLYGVCALWAVLVGAITVHCNLPETDADRFLGNATQRAAALAETALQPVTKQEIVGRADSTLAPLSVSAPPLTPSVAGADRDIYVAYLVDRAMERAQYRAAHPVPAWLRLVVISAFASLCVPALLLMGERSLRRPVSKAS